MEARGAWAEPSWVPSAASRGCGGWNQLIRHFLGPLWGRQRPSLQLRCLQKDGPFLQWTFGSGARLPMRRQRPFIPSALTSSPGLGAGQVPGSAEDTGQVAAVHRWALPGCQRRAPPCGLLGSISAPWATLCVGGCSSTCMWGPDTGRLQAWPPHAARRRSEGLGAPSS